jgi:hypothetical protein
MTLAEIIAARIAPATVERVVFDQGLLSQEQRDAIFKSNLPLQEVAKRLVAAYGDKSGRLAAGLKQQVADIDWDTAKELSHHFKGGYGSQQASLVGRIPTVSLPQLREFLENVEHQICLIVARDATTGDTVRGTGFLIAPDLVLTCQHVLKLFPKGQTAAGSQIEMHFDFVEGDEIDRVGLAVSGARKVTPAQPWHIDSCSGTEPDGLEGDLDAVDAARISNSLDFVLLKLAEPIGMQPISKGGGRRRGWIPVPPAKVVETLAPQDWIIIPQHPDGMPQRIDLGRYVEGDQTKTRIRYNTNTAPGTSGAPCFNQDFHLVGVHNARVGPKADPKANQAIRWDLVEDKVRAYLKELQSGGYVKRWSTSRDGEKHRVILGRGLLLDWLRASAVANPRHLADRVYVADATASSAGCSFSSEVLHAEIRDSRIPRAVYGGRGQQLPSTAEDFLESLLRELGIDPKSSESMPPRPGGGDATSGLPLLGGEVDKLERWLADELPAWLARVISTHLEREIDARPAAKEAVEAIRKLNQEPPDAVLKTAESATPVMIRVNPWEFAYVVIDELRAVAYNGAGARTELKGEVLSLVAALVKGKPEPAMPGGLKRLRWMFLGYLPDFIKAAAPGNDTVAAGAAPLAADHLEKGNGAIVEHLDANAAGIPDIVAMLANLFDAKLPVRVWDEAWAKGIALACLDFVNGEPPGAPRLERLQHYAGVLAVNQLKVSET